MYSFPFGGYGAAGGVLPVTNDADLKTWMHGRRGLFPALYTLMAFAILGSPVMSGVRLASDLNVSYWMGSFGWMVILVPLMLIVSHVTHATMRRPNFYAMLFSTVVPALLVVLIGFVHQGRAHAVSSHLLQTDCVGYHSSAVLNAAYKSADANLKLCMERVAKIQNVNVSKVKGKVTFPDCTTYIQGDAAQKWRHEWAYLKKMEETEGCAGWCDQTSSAVFTASEGKHDTCSQVAGTILATTVRNNASRMSVVGLMGLVVGSLLMVGVQELLVRTGIQW